MTDVHGVSGRTRTVRSYAKVNLFLNIHSKRDDGFHNIQSVFQTVSLFDVLNFRHATRSTLRYCDDSPVVPEHNPEDDLVFKAYRLFASCYDIAPLEMTIYKNIPSGAGLGGGSSNAAAALMVFKDFYEKRTLKTVADDHLEEMGLSLGKDVPFFFTGGCARVEGTGDLITPLPPAGAQRFKIIVAFPDLFLSTSLAYAKRCRLNGQASFKKFSDALAKGDFQQMSRLAYNGFQDKTLKEFEMIRSVYNYLKTYTDYVLLSGSGAAVFAVFDSPKKAKTCYNNAENFKIKFVLTDTVYP